jgi:hypothetical protein
MCVSAGSYQEVNGEMNKCQAKKHIPRWHEVKKDLEDTRR